MLVRLILRNELANIVFCNVQKVQKMDVKDVLMFDSFCNGV